MQSYIGTKLINAKPMSRLEYNELRGWTLPEDENGDDAGFLVEYHDGGKPNHPDFAGYISWSPEDVFYNAYRPTSCMKFGDALEMLQRGHKVAREGWNGKGMFLIFVGGTLNCQLKEGTPYHSALNSDSVGQPEVTINPHIDMFTAQGTFQPGWLASQTDMLATDWCVVE